MKVYLSVGRDVFGIVGDFYAGVFVLLIVILGGRVVIGAGAIEVGFYSIVICVRVGRLWRLRIKVFIYGEIFRLGSRYK